jgi:hypothetical protein
MESDAMQRPSAISVMLPSVNPKNTWCARILEITSTAVKQKGIALPIDETVSIEVRVYLSGYALDKSDVDNLLVKVMNGLQGQTGGQGQKIMHPPVRVIRNDRLVWRAIIEKLERPADVAENVGGELTITFSAPGTDARSQL